MFYITEENATKFWGYLEAEVDAWERDTALAEKYAKRDWKLDSFSLEWKAELDAKELAIHRLRSKIDHARSGGETWNGQPQIVASIDGLLRRALSMTNGTSNFTAANLIQDKAAEMERNRLEKVFAFTIMAMTE
ncbi:MAG: hypothetical protein EBS38_02535 [Actinobacteria bacterium]|nr:hypothetical protein [Actinomycetota bacterium]